MLSTTNSPVTNYSAMIPMGTGIGGLLAWLLPAHCLHSLEKGLPLQRAFRQCVGNPEAIYPLYDNALQQSNGNYAFDFGSFNTGFFRWTGVLTSTHQVLCAGKLVGRTRRCRGG